MLEAFREGESLFCKGLYKKSYYSFQEAKKYGYSPALIFLGLLHEGIVKKLDNREKAVEFYKQAAKKKDDKTSYQENSQPTLFSPDRTPIKNPEISSPMLK